MSISYYNEEIGLPDLDFNLITRWIKGILRFYRKKLGNISYIFCSDQYLLNINIKFLKHNYLTDIITFDYVEEDIVSGDLYISVDRIFENSEIFNSEKSDEFRRVIVHGLLHLLGFKDKTPEELECMRNLEDKFLRKYLEYK